MRSEAAGRKQREAFQLAGCTVVQHCHDKSLRLLRLFWHLRSAYLDILTSAKS